MTLDGKAMLRNRMDSANAQHVLENSGDAMFDWYKTNITGALSYAKNTLVFPHHFLCKQRKNQTRCHTRKKVKKII